MDIEKERESILDAWKGGGEYAHQIVRFGLQAMAKVDRVAAEKLFEELQDEGY